MNILDHVRIMSRYNKWMNDKLYEVCAGLPDAARKEDRGAPFRSIHGTLNHLLLTDRAWLSRFTGAPFLYQTLADELYSDFGELRRERQATDDDIDAWAQSLTESSFEGELRFYSASIGREVVMPRGICIVHVFNHQTHHRGQLTTLLEQCGCDFGVTDLPRLPGVELSTQ